MTGPKRGRLLRLSGGILVLSGLAALAWCGVSLARTRLFQEQSSAALDREFLFRPVKLTVGPAPAPEEGALLGSISIPRVKVSSVILEGTDDRTLALSVGHVRDTALPGREGNVALAGHRDTFFRGLQNIRDRDEILLTTSRGSRLYEVESTRIVSPEDVYVLNDIGRPLLTLVTCYPFHYVGPAPKRFIVQAHPVGR
jgi:sortase A